MRKAKTYHLISVALLLLLTLIFFWQLITPVERNIVSLDPLAGGDLNGFYYPMFAFSVSTIAKGELPLWNPYSFCGAPQLADMQAGIFYPPNLILPLFVREGYLPYRAMELMIILHAFLAGFFMYLLARYLTRSIWGGLFAGIVFAFNGFMATYYATPSVAYTAVWIPLIFLAGLVAIEKGSIAYAALTGFLMGLSFLAGYLELFVYIFYSICGFFIYFCFVKKRLKILILLAVTILVTIGISAIQVLPTLELKSYVVGAKLGFSEPAANIPYSFLSPSSLITALIPVHPEWNSNIYCGILTLIFAFLIFIDRNLRKNSLVRFFAGLAILSILLSFGKTKFLYEISYLILPGVDFGRTPVMFGFLYACSVSVLAGWGLSLLVKVLNREFKHSLYAVYKRLVSTFLILAGLLVFVYVNLFFSKEKNIIGVADRLGWSIVMLGLSILVILFRLKAIGRMRLVSFLFFVLLILDLFSLRQINKFYINQPPESHYPLSPLIEFLKNDKDIYRINVRDFSPVFAEGAGNVHRLFLDTGYILRLSLKDYLQFVGLGTNLGIKEELPSIPPKRIMDMLNVKYILSVQRPDWGVRLEEVPIPGLLGNIKVFENPDYLPRAWLVNGEVEVIPDKVEAFEKMSAKGFDPMRSIILEEPYAEFENISEDSSEAGESSVEITDYSVNNISLAVSAKEDGFMVLNEVFYPGWKAYIDGNEERMYRADHLFRAVPIHKGEHKVKMVFSPVSFKIGLGITLSTVLMIALVWLFLRRYSLYFS